MSRVSGPLREAETQIALSLARLSEIGPGNPRSWTGSWQEFKDIARLLCKTKTLAARIEQCEYRVRRRNEKH